MQSLEQQLGPGITRSLFLPHSQPPVQVEAPCPTPAATSSHALGCGAKAALDISLAEGAAGLLAMSSAADKSDLTQVSRCTVERAVSFLQLESFCSHHTHNGCLGCAPYQLPCC